MYPDCSGYPLVWYKAIWIFIAGTADGDASPPYDRLPDNYYDLYPTSYYATHTHVPPLAKAEEAAVESRKTL